MVKVAEQEIALMTNRVDFIRNAEIAPYNVLVREPYKFEGKILAVTVDIKHIYKDRYSYQGFELDSSGEWYIICELPPNTPRILVGDRVTFYGKFEEKFELENIPILTADTHNISGDADVQTSDNSLEMENELTDTQNEMNVDDLWNNSVFTMTMVTIRWHMSACIFSPRKVI
jgi:hypothetical protein